MNTDAIRALNDEFRNTLTRGRVMLTAGIADRQDTAEILKAVQTFDKFDEANDPHGEHDFGAFEAGRDTIFWKIDYYNWRLDGGSEDPSNPKITLRVLTVMLAIEY